MGSMHAALALSVGYLLGRPRTRRMASVLAAAAAAGCLGGAALRRGMTTPGPAPAPGKAAAQPGDLPSAGTAAATAVTSNRIGSPTGPPHERTALVRDPALLSPGPARRVPVRQPGTHGAATARRQAAQARGGREPARP